MIPYGRQTISESDLANVEAVLRSDFLTQGPCVANFEKALCVATGSLHAIAVNSATSALHLACLALGLGEGDVLWTSPITFVASANCALYCGASVDFVDIDPLTWTMSPIALRAKINETLAARLPLPKIIIPVHFAGQSADMEAISSIARTYDIRIIEDAAHAIGASSVQGLIGNCAFSDVTVFSFHPVKIITTGEGGAALTNDSRIARRIEILRTHGITRETSEMMPNAIAEPWYYEQIDLGYNYRLTDIAAALGSSQIQRLNEFVVRRNLIADKYDHFFSNMEIQRQLVPPEDRSARHLYVARFPEKNRNFMFNSLRAAGIGVNLHYIPVYRQPYFAKMGFIPEKFPASEKFYREAISLPIFPAMLESEQEYVCSVIDGELRA